jgi:monoamine oxidase
LPVNPLVKSDILIIGAGVSGLAAAADLSRRGLKVSLLEARDRTGGRILSLRPSGWDRAVELGAEFIHGGNPELSRVLKQAGIKKHQLEISMWWSEQGRLEQRQDFWPLIERIVDRVPARDRGWSFAEFLRRQPRLSASERRLAGNYVGSFNGGPIGRISVHALRADGAGAKNDDFLPDKPYRSVVDELERQCRAQGVELYLRAPATQVRWRAGAATVSFHQDGQAKPRELSARTVLVTLPLGVLRANRMKFSPALTAKRKLIAQLGWGRVVRVVLRFRPGFWSAPFLPRQIARQKGKHFGFVNAPGEAMPVWWALHPPAPILTGWAGGEIADPLLELRPAALLRQAVRSLAKIFSVRESELGRWLADWRTHDWQHDPFTLGAYSFAAAGCDDGPKRLAQPVQNTLFFAGEATADDLGTVHGALASGVRAAKEIRKALAKR